MALLIAELFIGFSITAKNATLAGLIEISYPIFIALFSFILFRSVVNLPTMLGGMIIFVGVFVIYYFNN
jgi:drug/metabolite transporter (DMT)-like permease